jgi:hypothetical protein
MCAQLSASAVDPSDRSDVSAQSIDAALRTAIQARDSARDSAPRAPAAPAAAATPFDAERAARELARAVRSEWGTLSASARSTISTSHDAAAALPARLMLFARTLVEELDALRQEAAIKRLRSRAKKSNVESAALEARIADMAERRQRRRERKAVFVASWLLRGASAHARPAVLVAATRLAGRPDQKSVGSLGRLLVATGVALVGSRHARRQKAARQRAAKPATRLRRGDDTTSYVTLAMNDNLDVQAAAFSRAGMYDAVRQTQHISSLVAAQLAFPTADRLLARLTRSLN